MNHRLIILPDGSYGMTVNERGGFIRFVNKHGVPYIVCRDGVSIIISRESIYTLKGDCYRESDRIPDDEIALQLLHNRKLNI